MNLTFIKKHMVFTLCLGVTVFLLIGAGVGLFFAQRLYARKVLAMDNVMTRLQQLYRRDPFPAAENVRAEDENLKDVTDRYNELVERLRLGQVDLQSMEAADFMQFLEQSLRKLRGRLQKARIRFPEKYAFGFDKYAVGQLPAPGDIPRLVQQLKIIEALCDILEQAAITELVSIVRVNFEQAARGAMPAKAADVSAGGGKLFSSQHFDIEVKARENAVITMLNLLASHPMFMVVTRIEMNNLLQEYSTGGSAAGQAAAARLPGTPGTSGVSRASASDAHERQVVLGREELIVKLGVDVYQFAPPLVMETLSKTDR